MLAGMTHGCGDLADAQTKSPSPTSPPTRISQEMCGRDSSGATWSAPCRAAQAAHTTSITAATPIRQIHMEALYDGGSARRYGKRTDLGTSSRVLHLDHVRRFALAIIVALLTFSASGVSASSLAEPCTGYEPPGSDDSACPPTCVTCGCCAQAAEPAIMPVASSLEAPVADISPVIPRVPKTSPRDILHVPKPRLA